MKIRSLEENLHMCCKFEDAWIKSASVRLHMAGFVLVVKEGEASSLLVSAYIVAESGKGSFL